MDRRGGLKRVLESLSERERGRDEKKTRLGGREGRVEWEGEYQGDMRVEGRERGRKERGEMREK